MANQLLGILRKVTVLILLLEGAILGQGLIMSMNRSERILLGFGCAVIRSGYLFSPLVWLGWTGQLLIICFFPSTVVVGHFLFLIGLSSIRLSHYAASLEDLKYRKKNG